MLNSASFIPFNHPCHPCFAAVKELCPFKPVVLEESGSPKNLAGDLRRKTGQYRVVLLHMQIDGSRSMAALPHRSPHRSLLPPWHPAPSYLLCWWRSEVLNHHVASRRLREGCFRECNGQHSCNSHSVSAIQSFGDAIYFAVAMFLGVRDFCTTSDASRRACAIGHQHCIVAARWLRTGFVQRYNGDYRCKSKTTSALRACPVSNAVELPNTTIFQARNR